MADKERRSARKANVPTKRQDKTAEILADCNALFESLTGHLSPAREYRKAKPNLVEDFRDLEDRQLCLHTVDALECAFAAVAILDSRTAGSGQHVACMLASDLQRALEKAERMYALYELR